MEPVVQKHPFGCGVACVAYITRTTYDSACNVLGLQKANNSGFLCKELQLYIRKTGVHYDYKYIKPKQIRQVYKDGTIIFLKRSKQFPVGHYLARMNGEWMDPWINFNKDSDIKNAKAGFRKRLPYSPSYALIPC